MTEEGTTAGERSNLRGMLLSSLRETPHRWRNSRPLYGMMVMEFQGGGDGYRNLEMRVNERHARVYLSNGGNFLRITEPRHRIAEFFARGRPHRLDAELMQAIHDWRHSVHGQRGMIEGIRASIDAAIAEHMALQQQKALEEQKAPRLELVAAAD